jgi:hypothetical protein
VSGRRGPRDGPARHQPRVRRVEGAQPAQVSFSEATPRPPQIFLADRPKSAQATSSSACWDRRKGWRGRTSRSRTVLGGGVVAALPRRGEALTRVQHLPALKEVARGPVPLTAHAGTQTAKTGLAAGASRNLAHRQPGERRGPATRAVSSRTSSPLEENHGLGRGHGRRAQRARPARRLLRRVPKALANVSADQAEKAIAEPSARATPSSSFLGTPSAWSVLSHFQRSDRAQPRERVRARFTIPNPDAPIELDRRVRAVSFVRARSPSPRPGAAQSKARGLSGGGPRQRFCSPAPTRGTQSGAEPVPTRKRG